MYIYIYISTDSSYARLALLRALDLLDLIAPAVHHRRLGL